MSRNTQSDIDKTTELLKKIQSISYGQDSEIKDICDEIIKLTDTYDMEIAPSNKTGCRLQIHLVAQNRRDALKINCNILKNKIHTMIDDGSDRSATELLEDEYFKTIEKYEKARAKSFEYLTENIRIV